jgi:hypothetical protein
MSKETKHQDGLWDQSSSLGKWSQLVRLVAINALFTRCAFQGLQGALSQPWGPSSLTMSLSQRVKPSIITENELTIYILSKAARLKSWPLFAGMIHTCLVLGCLAILLVLAFSTPANMHSPHKHSIARLSAAYP